MVNAWQSENASSPHYQCIYVYRNLICQLSTRRIDNKTTVAGLNYSTFLVRIVTSHRCFNITTIYSWSVCPFYARDRTNLPGSISSRNVQLATPHPSSQLHTTYSLKMVSKQRGVNPDFDLRAMQLGELGTWEIWLESTEWSLCHNDDIDDLEFNGAWGLGFGTHGIMGVW